MLMLTALASTLSLALFGIGPGEASTITAPTLRYAMVFQETMDSDSRSTSTAELEVTRLLLERGIVFVDEAQSRKIRSVTSAGALIAGGIPPVITPRDADVIVAGISRLTRVKSDLLGEDVFLYAARIEVKLIAVDTAKVIAALDANGKGRGFDKEQAAAAAAKNAAAALSTDILAKAPKQRAGRSFDLEIAAVPDVSAIEHVASVIGRVSGVSRVQVLNADPASSKLSIETSLATARELALAIEHAQGVGIRVFGYSEGAIKAEYSVARAMQLGVVLGAFKQLSGDQHLAWQGRVIREVIGDAVTRTGIGSVKTGVSVGAESRGWAKELARKDLAPACAVVLQGSFRADAAKTEVRAEAVSAESGVVVASARKSCTNADLAPCAEELGGALEKSLTIRITSGAGWARCGAGSPGSAVASASISPEQRPLEVVRLSAENVFPSLLAAYTDRPIGYLVLRNRGKAKLTGIVVSTQLPTFMKSALTTDPVDLAPKAEIDLLLKVVLDRDVLMTHDQNEPAVLGVEVEYNLGDFRLRETRRSSVVVYGRNAMTWQAPDSIASFVVARSAEVQEMARDWAGMVPERAKERPLSAPVALFRGLGGKRLRYTPDPHTPVGSAVLDYVEYPAQTLCVRGGDCDDLSVLYAALTEAVGIPTLLLTTPGHVLVAVSTGLSAQSARFVTASAEDLVIHKGRAFVPVETTKLGGSFEDAWRAAVHELALWRGRDRNKIGIIDVRQAWKRFPPVNLAASCTGLKDESDKAKLAQAIESEIEALESKRLLELSHELESIDHQLDVARTDERRSALQAEKGWLLAVNGREDEAKPILEEAARRDPKNLVALNNLGNLLLVAGQVKEALDIYRKALRVSKKQSILDVRLNALIAALVLGNKREYGELVADCVEAGAEEEVAAIAGALSTSEGERGAGTQDLPARNVDVAIRRARQLDARSSSTARAKPAVDSARPLRRFVRWLSPR